MSLLFLDESRRYCDRYEYQKHTYIFFFKKEHINLSVLFDTSLTNEFLFLLDIERMKIKYDYGVYTIEIWYGDEFLGLKVKKLPDKDEFWYTIGNQ